MRTALEIHALYKRRMESMGRLFSQMREVRDVYNGDIVLPLPEMNTEEKAAVANLTQQGMDQLARRVASVLPNIVYPPLKPGITQSKQKARDRKAVNVGWWDESDIQGLLGYRSRHWLGYGCSPVLICPDPVTKVPKWKVRSPLDTYPAPRDPNEITPEDCIFTAKHTLKWLKDRYPVQAALLHKSGGHDVTDDMEFLCLEYIDAEEYVLIACGHDPTPYDIRQPIPGCEALDLERVVNKAEECWAVIPGRVTLDRPQGHFDGILGMYETQAQLMAMEVIATQRAIWPREWVVANQNEMPKIIQNPDPGAGIPGMIQGGTIERQQLDPTFRADQTMALLENAQRQTSGLPAELGGQASSNIRTGRRGSQVLGASIDYTIGEAQERFGKSLQEENRRAHAIDKAYFDTKKTYYISAIGYQSNVTYKPSDLWETDDRGRVPHVCIYPLPGTDMGNVVLEGGQRVGMGTMSKETFMELDPAIHDAEAEMDRIKAQGLDDAFFSALQTMAANPEGPWQPIHLARLKKMMLSEQMDWEEAVTKLQEEIQKEQATPVGEGAPETMPGLSPPEQGVEAPAAIPEATPSMDNLTGLLSSLGTTQQAQRARPG